MYKNNVFDIYICISELVVYDFSNLTKTIFTVIKAEFKQSCPIQSISTPSQI